MTHDSTRKTKSMVAKRKLTHAERRALNDLFERKKRKAIQRACEESVRGANGCEGAEIEFEVEAKLHDTTKRGRFTLTGVGICPSIFDSDDLCVIAFEVRSRRGSRKER